MRAIVFSLSSPSFSRCPTPTVRTREFDEKKTIARLDRNTNVTVCENINKRDQKTEKITQLRIPVDTLLRIFNNVYIFILLFLYFSYSLRREVRVFYIF